ncbi:MAG: hypothetical protein NT029_05325 [Armatimonadetes bacterium]|nr:hypothetical protein [Armatimonadota bacterium]
MSEGYTHRRTVNRLVACIVLVLGSIGLWKLLEPVGPEEMANRAATSEAAHAQVRRLCDGAGLSVDPVDASYPNVIAVRAPRELTEYEARVIANNCFEAAGMEDAVVAVYDGSGKRMARRCRVSVE